MNSKKQIANHIGKHYYFFMGTQNYHYNNILEMYKEFTIDTVVKYDDYCHTLVTKMHEALELKLVTKRELSDVVYGEGQHINRITSFLDTYAYYEEYSFLSRNAFETFVLIKLHILRKVELLKELVNEY